MQYNEKDSIKGDYKVDPRGTSALLERDQQAQSIEEITAMRGDQELSDMVDWEKAVSQLFSARNMDILLPKEKITENRNKRKNQPQPMDPQMEVAKVRAQAELEKAKLVQTADMEELKFKAEQAKLDHAHKEQMKLMDRDIKAMELSASSGMALDKIKAQLSETSAKLRLQDKLAHDKDVVAAEQVATPIAEPAGRAKEGHAYQD
jgi:Rps23 Pro-64 3,4-dihydroxylase Tpa1-like proline 4-hydroxylase